jgi:hypothetical protein
MDAFALSSHPDGARSNHHEAARDAKDPISTPPLNKCDIDKRACSGARTPRYSLSHWLRCERLSADRRFRSRRERRATGDSR